MWCSKYLLVLYIGLASCRPQNQKPIEPQKGGADSQVQVERQFIHEVIPLDNPQDRPKVPYSAQRKIDANTKEILDKIAEVNKKQGLLQKKPKPSYFHFPFSYSRSQDQLKSAEQFKFSRDPFSNPILDYLENDHIRRAAVPSLRQPNVHNAEHLSGFSATDNNPEILPEDQIPGQYVKRKVTHYQSFMAPNPYMNNMFGALPEPAGNYYPSPNNPLTSELNTQNTPLLQKQTVDNIRDIMLQYPINLQQQYQQPMLNNYQQQSGHKARQNWNWPGANLFPIYIRDPFLQMYYAVTNMVEYGNSAGTDGPCKLTPRPQPSRVKSTPALGHHQVSVEMNKKVGTKEIKIAHIEGEQDPAHYLDLEDIDLGDEDLVKFTVNLPMDEGRGLNENINTEKINWNSYFTPQNETQLANLILTHKPEPKESPQIIRQSVQIEEVEDDLQEAEKAENISVSNEGSRKVFSKDNTGNGIFIHKLKVRKGGVAIAGPGGIATAGSGGTAIVGPNGVAYTHPDGLAIAGSGTKVVAVDPKIDLNEVIKDSALNGTKHEPNIRIGKVVAVGPVVYYNRGNEY
ncbi:uncharacterized protein [Euwallacea similis]|uniref:uncharacterized protein isoform X1 n=1 Tax=Euwallacea similis TaxID=1736056 RepID=UPI0034502153